MVAEVTVRDARISDLDELLTLYDVLAGEKRSAAPGDRAGSAPLLEEVLADRSRHLAIAELDGQAAGTADVLIVANLTHHGMPWAIVENVIVAEAHRRKGVATSLMRHLVHTAREAGCFKLELLSGKHRAPAHALYRSVGLDAVSEGFKIYFDA